MPCVMVVKIVMATKMMVMRLCKFTNDTAGLPEKFPSVVVVKEGKVWLPFQ